MTTAIDDIAAGASELPLPDGVWTLDRQHSEIGFAVRDLWGLRTVRGLFNAYEGSLTVRGTDAAGVVEIEADSLDTRNRRRDKHLRSPAFFDTERYPRIELVTTALTPGEGGLTVSGELAVGKARVGIEIPIAVEQLTDGALRLEGEVAVSREAAGVGWNALGMIRGDAVLHAGLTLERIQ